MKKLSVPAAASSIEKGVPLKLVLDLPVVEQIGENLNISWPEFDTKAFVKETMDGLDVLGFKDRSIHIAKIMRQFLPSKYSQAVQVLEDALTPALEKTANNGLAPMFYMPHNSFVALYGVDKKYNEGEDPFDISMLFQKELTQRFTCEFSIRAFIESDQDRALAYLYEWVKDPNPHVRRLCSEGTRSRLPWARKLKSIAADPTPILPILEALKNDKDLYVRRSVANHVGDVAKDHLELALDLCESWLNGASPELKWVIRHALRNPFKKGNQRAISLRQAAK